MQTTKRSLEELWAIDFDDLHNFEEQVSKRHRKLCQGAIGCSKVPIYGINSRKPTHCLLHKDGTMINVLSRRCQHPSGCNTQASFGYSGDRPVYCKTHKLGDMVNVVSKRCAQEGCLMIPSFGFDRGMALRCGSHRLAGMWNVSASTCKVKDCKTFATYGYMSHKVLRCSTHRLPDMMTTKELKRLAELAQNVAHASPPPKRVAFTFLPHPRCNHCPTRAFYGNCETGRQFCRAHMNPKVHWRVSFCENPSCKQVATRAQHGYYVCEAHAEPFSVRLPLLQNMETGNFDLDM
jgi:hypothetical protein